MLLLPLHRYHPEGIAFAAPDHNIIPPDGTEARSEPAAPFCPLSFRSPFCPFSPLSPAVVAVSYTHLTLPTKRIV